MLRLPKFQNLLGANALNNVQAKIETRDENVDEDINPPAAADGAATATPFKVGDRVKHKGAFGIATVTKVDDHKVYADYDDGQRHGPVVCEFFSLAQDGANDNEAGPKVITPASPAFVFTPYVPIDDPAKLPRREYSCLGPITFANMCP